MSSILTNNGAMVALQTLKSVNSSLSDTQSAISTGKKVANAKQNAAVWAISKTMESDVNGFKSVKESLSLGESTVAVARNATETVTDLLGQMKERIVAAQGDNVDQAKLQAEVSELRDQIGSVVGAAQFNGLNLVSGTGSTEVLSSLDRASDGTVTASNITVNFQDLSTGGYTAKAAFGGATDGVAADNQDSFAFTADANGGTSDNGSIVIDSAGAGFAAGDKINIQLGEDAVSYTITADDLAATSVDSVIANGLKKAIEESGANVTVDYNTANAGQLDITNDDTTDSLLITGQFQNAGSGGLSALANINVDDGAGGNSAAALGAIEGLITTTIDAAAAFGTVESRISTQKDFVSKLSDSLTSGIGSMVDADMEETSARLQALQVQQQLATQSLSIANQAPQQLLSLFR